LTPLHVLNDGNLIVSPMIKTEIIGFDQKINRAVKLVELSDTLTQNRQIDSTQCFTTCLNTKAYLSGTCKMRNEIETKRNEINRNETKFTETKRNRTETKLTETKRNETE
jgi:hypothetical protein